MSFAQRFFLTTFFCSLSPILFAQDRCATVKYEELRKLQNPKKETKQQFEDWLKQKSLLKPMEANRTQQTQATYVIPVVVHIIHNGEAIGTGTNLSVAQIQSQIDVLNKDFHRLNADASLTPTAFRPLAGTLDVDFVLAKQSPTGAPSDGIRRVQGTQSSWSLNDNGIFKGLSYWPAEKYLNIWVVKFSNGNDLGYAQFPVSNLNGLQGSPDDRLTDGVTVSYTAFGSIDNGAFNLEAKYNKGRTVTHEVGHFFGLHHIWGDENGCTGTDYVEDTPNQAGSYLNLCPTGTKNTCSSDNMYMNYMDYTNDACMNLFSKGQIGRVNIVMQNSPRRFSLLNAMGAFDPLPVALDASIEKIISPGTSACGDAITPSIQIQNLGTNNMTSVRVQLKVNNAIVATNDFLISLANLQFGTLQFAPTLFNTNNLKFDFEILQVNGSADGRAFNNTASVTTTIPPLTGIPISENFTSLPASWKVHNPDNLITWSIYPTQTNGNALRLNSFGYSNLGAIDQVTTPVLDLTNVTFAYLKFDRAYEYYGEGFEERLRVLVSPLCDFNNSPGILFDKSGLDLATTLTSSGSDFSPAASQWETEIISLDQYLGKKIQIAFEGINAYGNNQYLDNIVVSTDQFTDLAILSLESPSPVSCNLNSTLTVRAKNMGTTAITSFQAQAIVNNQTINQTFSGINMKAGMEQVFALNPVTLKAGLNTISFFLTNPNGGADANTTNNSLAVTRIINSASDIIPLRQNFENSFPDWSIISQGQQEKWTATSTNNGTSVAFTAFQNVNVGEESWLVSPVLDFSKAFEASLFFDVGYANNFIGSEQLKVLYSEDCGVTFKLGLYSQSGSALATTDSESAWAPTDTADWRKEYINLNTLAGKTNVRLAFVATTGNGNNLYIDNIEFFIDDNDEPLSIEESFSVYGSGNDLRITFNLAERQSVDVRIYNSIGQLMLSSTLPETLNQTFYFDMGQQTNDIYIVKVQYGDTVKAVRVYLGH